MRRSLSDNGTSHFRSDDDAVGGDVTGRCSWTLRGVGQCAHVLVPFGFAVTLMWICVLWMVVRVLRRRRPAVVVDASSTLCTCRSLRRSHVLAGRPTASGCPTGKGIFTRNGGPRPFKAIAIRMLLRK